MVYPERIRQARELRGLTQTELANRLGTHQELVAEMEAGRRPATERVDALALATGLPPAFFGRPMLETWPLGSLLFRARRTVMTKKHRSEAHRFGQILFEVYERLSEGRILPESRLPQVLDAHPTEAAQLARGALGLDPCSPIRRLLHVLERHGVVVLALPAQLQGREGFSLWLDQRPVIVISSDLPGDRLRWTVAHEVGHLVLHRSLRGNLSDLEAQADSFAAEFLTPREAMIEEFRLGAGFHDICELKPKWGVSIQSLARRAKEVGALSERQYYAVFSRLRQVGYSRAREPEAFDIPREKPRVLRQLAERLYGVPVDFARFARDHALPASLLSQVLEAHAAPVVPVPRNASPAEANAPPTAGDAPPESGTRTIPFRLRH